MGETWLPIAWSNGDYEVSSEGRLRSRISGEWVIRKATPDKDGYLTFMGRRPRKRCYKLHREVCIAFNGPPPFDGAMVRHLDGDVTNNRSDNLAWGTRKENSMDAVRHGTTHAGERHPMAKLTRFEVEEIRAAEGVHKAVSLARRYGVTDTTIYRIWNDQRWSKGRKSEYLVELRPA